MAVKSTFTKEELANILLGYNLGELREFSPISKGTVQTNFILQTSKGKLVFRYYENRSKESVVFECNLIDFLKRNNYPCPALFKNTDGEFVGVFKDKPYVIFEFIDGEHIEYPSEEQKNQLIQEAAKLHNLTQNYQPVNKEFRWNYNLDLCGELARKETLKLNTEDAKKKLAWFESELAKLDLPDSLPMGVCHCDFHFSNVLFKDGKFVALIDFDDANYTYLLFDLVGLVESEAWQKDVDTELNFNKAKRVVSEYSKYRGLEEVEKLHLFDVYKLSILFDCIWYFGRGNAEDFFEKRKIDFLNSVGRDKFHNLLF